MNVPAVLPSKLDWKMVVLCAFSLSIGWGVRGNFGHEYGAMLPGCLTAIAICLMSGREDWRERVHYFAMFGALGWGFGGSISYMQVVGYTHMGSVPEIVYGFLMLFFIGFLWGGMGGLGTALPAVVDKERLVAFFKPLCWIFAAWFVLNMALPFINDWQNQHAKTWSRHESPLYWFDADWIQAVSALIGLFLFDLWDRRKEGGTIFLHAPLVSLLAVVGGAIGWGIQKAIDTAGLNGTVSALFVRRQGDLELARKQAEELALTSDKTAEVIYEEMYNNFLINWPQFFLDAPQTVGIIFGVSLALTVYFFLFGKFRSGASLFVYMASGWLISFIVMPTLLNLHITPPRADDWAGITGVFIGACIWLCRNKLVPVVYAGCISGIIGGLGFAGATWLKLMLMAPGNPHRLAGVDTPEAKASIETWNHWQGSNWHSFLEQSYGFINGIAIAVALGLLAMRLPAVKNTTEKAGRWTEVFAVSFVLFFVTLFNARKNVPEWIKRKLIPEEMQIPLIDIEPWSTWHWYHIFWLFGAFAGIALLAHHVKKERLAFIPESWLGKGQLLYLVFVWLVCFFNFERAISYFGAGRLLTEGVITINTVFVTMMILLWPPTKTHRVEGEDKPYGASFKRIAVGLLIALGVTVGGMSFTKHMVYGDSFAGHAGENYRFGPKANWRIKSIVLGEDHR